ncbi:MAG: DUF4330 domain-containing protein [Coriobacteriia bacterium]|nr:DUF4330 domain-containing protein [Coriobacteriia bacterium]
MQIFDRKYRLFGVINLIDLLVIVAVLVGGFAVYRLLARSKATSGAAEGTNVTYTVMCPAVRGVGPSLIKVGDVIYKNTGKPIGTVTAVRGVPTPGEAWDQQSRKIVPYSSTVYTDIYIDVTTKGTPTGSGVAVGDLLLHAQQPMPVMTSTFECDTANIATLTIGGK